MARTSTHSPPAHHQGSPADFFARPPRAQMLAGWALLPLRLFIGGTFVFAGLQKLANPNFFDANSSTSIQAQLIASARTSPIHLLIGHLIQYATPLGILIAFSEIAIGLGMVLGLWTRIAALGGMALSLGLFLTVSYHSSPFYTGADVVWFFSFIPFLIAGAGGAPSLDTGIARRSSEEVGHGDPTPYVLSFASVQDLCGSYEKGRCRARSGALCSPAGCPVLEGGRRSVVARKSVDEVDRRAVVIGAGAVAAAGVATVVLGGAAAGIGRAMGRAPKATSSTTQLAPTPTTTPQTNATSPTTGSLGVAIGAASTVPVGGAATFTTPQGDPGIVLQPTKGTFVGYDAICPHAGCTAAFSKAADLIVCPCHGSEFKISNGDVIAGPSPTGLAKYTISLGTDGQLYFKA